MRSITLILLAISILFKIDSLSAHHKLYDPDNPIVVMITDAGEIQFEIYLDRAPVTAANFLYYVKNGLYTGACFYRVVKMNNQPNKHILPRS